MYSILINKKDYAAKTLELTVFVLQYDIENQTHALLPKEKTFFLDFLLKSSRFSALRKLTPQNYDAIFLSANAALFIASIEVKSISNFPFSKWQKKFQNKKKIALKDFPQLVQANYVINLKEELYMDHILEGFYYSDDYVEVEEINTIESELFQQLPNNENLRYEFGHTIENKTLFTQIKIAKNGAYIFLSGQDSETQENQLITLNTNDYSIAWQKNIQDAYANIVENSAEGEIYLHDFDEVLESFNIKHALAAPKPALRFDFFMSPSLNLFTHLAENEPIVIKNQNGEIICSIALDNKVFQTLAFSPEDKYIALGFNDFIEIWDIEKQTLIQSIFLGKGILQKIIFSPDSTIIFILLDKERIQALHLKTQRIIYTHQVDTRLDIVNDFDINEQFLILLKSFNGKLDYQPTRCEIYSIGQAPFILDKNLIQTLEQEAVATRQDATTWAKFLSTIPYNKETEKNINQLKECITADYDWMRLSFYFDKLRDWENAIYCAKIKVKLNRYNAMDLHNIAHYYMKLQDWKNAIIYFQKTLQEEHHEPIDALYMAECYTNMQDYQEAENILLKYIAERPSLGHIHIPLSRNYLYAKDLPKAKTAALQGIAKGEVEHCNINLAHTFYLSGDIENARQYYRISLENMSNKNRFLHEMHSTYKILATYDISLEVWQNFVAEF